MPNYVMNPLERTNAVISSGQSLSTGVSLDGLRLFALIMPSEWTSAGLTFQASYDNGVTWSNMYDANGSELIAVADVSRAIILDPVNFSSVPMIKIRSGTAASAVNQASGRTITLVLRAI